MSKIIQFMHPGRQKNLEEWNEFDELCDEHSAKFMVSPGSYVDKHHQSTAQKGKLYFWGEYEPQSKIIENYKKAPYGYPISLHQPCYPDLSKYTKHFHTTDPFVFGNCFKYIWCMQETFKDLRTLELGDLILFGSRRKKNDKEYIFGLDTVFVIGTRQPYTMNCSFDFSKVKYDDCYNKATIIPLSDTVRQLTFYQGATFEDQFENMFSFVPSRKENEPFAKFPIGNEEADEINRHIVSASLKNKNGEKVVINPKKSVGISCICTTQNSIKKVWSAIRDKVLNDKYVLGVQFDTPTPRQKITGGMKGQ